jgi:hypothetical protein
VEKRAHRKSGIGEAKSSRQREPRNPEPRIPDSAQSRAHVFGAWSSRRRPGEGALIFVIWPLGPRSVELNLRRGALCSSDSSSTWSGSRYLPGMNEEKRGWLRPRLNH